MGYSIEKCMNPCLKTDGIRARIDIHIESSLREQTCSILQPGSVVVKHGGLWSPRPQFESGPGYISELV